MSECGWGPSSTFGFGVVVNPSFLRNKKDTMTRYDSLIIQKTNLVDQGGGFLKKGKNVGETKGEEGDL